MGKGGNANSVIFFYQENFHYHFTGQNSVTFVTAKDAGKVAI